MALVAGTLVIVTKGTTPIKLDTLRLKINVLYKSVKSWREKNGC
jgi:hypothetical protein